MLINFEHHEMRKFCKLKLKLIKSWKMLINFEHHEISKFSNQN